MDVADKAVATDELRYTPNVHNTCVEVARLEAVLNSLVEQKVDAITRTTGSCRFIRAVSSAASPKTIAKRLRIASLSIPDNGDVVTTRYAKRKRRRRIVRQCEVDSADTCECCKHKGGATASRNIIKSGEFESSPIAVLHGMPSSTPVAIDDVYMQYAPTAGSCCCLDHHQSGAADVRIPMDCDDDYIALKIDDDGEYEDEYEARRRRRKRRKRRRKRRKLRAMAAVAIVEEVRHIDPDELPPKARWTIVATAGILLFMCLMLVGVTLRMAPLIDDMVRKENEALLHSLHGNISLPSDFGVKPPPPPPVL